MRVRRSGASFYRLSRRRGLAGAWHLSISSFFVCQGVRPGDIENAAQVPTAVRACPRVAGTRTPENCIAHCARAGLLAILALKAQQKSGNAGHNRCGEAAPCQRRGATGNRAQNVLTGREDSVLAVSRTPVTALQRLAVLAHGADGKNWWQSRRDMQALATIVPGSGDKKHTVVIAQPNRERQHAVCFAFWRQLAAADVDDVRPCLYRLFNRPRQV
jgi:hypothetical protein